MGKRLKSLHEFLRIEYIALVLSGVAIWATYKQDVTNREFYELSVKPLMDDVFSASPYQIKYTISNYGLGVAVIDSINIWYKGNKTSTEEMVNVIQDYLLDDINKSFVSGIEKNFSGDGGKRILKPESNLDLFSVKLILLDSTLNVKYRHQEVFKLFNQIKIKLYYRDLYNNIEVYGD